MRYQFYILQFLSTSIVTDKANHGSLYLKSPGSLYILTMIKRTSINFQLPATRGSLKDDIFYVNSKLFHQRKIQETQL